MSMLSKYFSEKEMQCKHTGICEMSPTFMEKLDRLREAFGAPLTVSSGFRHPTHPIENAKVLKGKKAGTHSTGRAADIVVSRGDAHKLLQLALASGDFTGIGVQQKGTSRFIHLDDLQEGEGYSPRPTVWSY